jgi:hypothetical protein
MPRQMTRETYFTLLSKFSKNLNTKHRETVRLNSLHIYETHNLSTKITKRKAFQQTTCSIFLSICSFNPQVHEANGRYTECLCV